MQIDWTNLKAPISKWFTVKDALWLPSWKALHIPTEEEKANILKMAQTMDKIREFLASPISIHCWLRPMLNCPGHANHGQDYNAFVKGAKASKHKSGLAVDWSAKGKTCDQVRTQLIPQLEAFGIRVEKLDGSNWVHTDIGQPINGVRYFPV